MRARAEQSSETQYLVRRTQYAAPVALLLVAAILLVFPVALPAGEGASYSDDERSHWSLRPRSQPALPTFTDRHDAVWLANPIDAFVLKRIRDAGLQPAPTAEPRVLARRLYFNLIGLPPTPGEI